MSIVVILQTLGVIKLTQNQNKYPLLISKRKCEVL